MACRAGTNYGPYDGPAMPKEYIANGYEDFWRHYNRGTPVPSNGQWTDEPGACYIWEPNPGTGKPFIPENGGKPPEIVFC